MSLFRLDASIRTEESASRAIADLVEASWHEHRPNDAVTTRHIGLEPIPASAWANAVSAGRIPAEQRSPDQVAATRLAAALTDELVGADALLLAVPLYNFGVSQHFKAWVDLVLTDPRLSPGAAPILAGKPAVLATVRGGSYSPGTPRHGWDHATGWTRRILADVWQLDLEVVEREFTLAGVNPALDEFVELADRLRIEAEANARDTGRRLAQRQPAAA